MSLDVLVIDDEELFRRDVAALLQSEGFSAATAATGAEGLREAERERPKVVLTDLVMPGMGGLEVVDRLGRVSPQSSVVVVTAFGTLQSAVQAFRRGAADYLIKPVAPEDLFAKVQRLCDLKRMERELRYLRRSLSEAGPGTRLVGDSPPMRQVRELIEKVAGAPSPVLIVGATGTGKELVARAIHDSGPGEIAPFVAVNCSALPSELVESELFGHREGAFTGAVRDKPGVFELAAEGTLFLDEVAEMPLELQPKLLRAIEERRVTPVGATRSVPTPVRIVAATNRHLKREVAEGRFRKDLYFRIRVVEISLPELRDRREDIPLLVEHLLQRLNDRLGRDVRDIGSAVMRRLMAADWPGNVRELENVLERSILLADGEAVELHTLPAEIAGTTPFRAPSDDLRAGVRAYEAHHIRHVLRKTGGNRERAARRMGIDSSTLYRRLKELDLRPEE